MRFNGFFAVLVSFFFAIPAAQADLQDNINRAMSAEQTSDSGQRNNGAPSLFSDKVVSPEKLEPLEIEDLIAVEASNGQMFFMSKNGRYLIKGEVHDVWGRKVLQTVEDVKESKTKISLDAVRRNFEELSPVEVGDGRKTAYVYMAPSCDRCKQMAEALLEGIDGVSFEIHVIPKNKWQRDEASRIACVPPEHRDELVLEAIATESIMTLPQKDECDMKAYIKAAVVGDQMGFDTGDIPFAIRWDGAHRPWDSGVMEWLKAGTGQ